MMVADYLQHDRPPRHSGRRPEDCPHPSCVWISRKSEAETEREFLGEKGTDTNFKREWPPRYERVVGKFANADDDLSALLALQIEGVPLHRYRWSPLSDDTQYVIERIDDDNGS